MQILKQPIKGEGRLRSGVWLTDSCLLLSSRLRLFVSQASTLLSDETDSSLEPYGCYILDDASAYEAFSPDFTRDIASSADCTGGAGSCI